MTIHEEAKPRDPQPIVLKFGGGLHSAASPFEIDARECSVGKNFDLDLEDSSFSRRRPFDLDGTTTNAQPIWGGAQFKAVDGTISTLIQSGNVVYSWDGATTYTQVGTVAAGAKLRGHISPHISSNDLVNGFVIITDLAEKQPVMTWDGTTFAVLAHNLGGDFFARYCVIENERAWYFNVKSGGDSTPHIFVGAERSDPTVLDVTNRAGSAVGAADAFFLISPDLRPINGAVIAFNSVVFSTESGKVYKLTGSDQLDFGVAPLESSAGVTGEEALASIGNDIMIGNIGKIETAFGVETFGDVLTDDATRPIKTDVENVDDWLITYNPRLSKVYCVNPEQSRTYVFHKAIFDEITRKTVRRSTNIKDVSPWSVWTTNNALAFQPKMMMTLRHPITGRWETYMGGATGQIYRLEGDGAQDGGDSDLDVDRTSAVISIPMSEIFEISGEVIYRKKFGGTLTLTALWGGRNISDETVTVVMNAAEGGSYFGGSAYFGGAFYFGTEFSGRFERQHFDLAGTGDTLQIKAAVSGDEEFTIQEIRLKVKVVA